MKANKVPKKKASSDTRSADPAIEIKKLIDKEIEGLDNPDGKAAAVAAASLAMLAQSAQEFQPALLDAIPKLITIMALKNDELQRNAVVALVSIVHGGEQFWKIACDNNAVSSATALMSSPKQDPSLRLNAAVLAGALIEGGESGPSTFYKENGLEALMPILTPETDAQLLEAAVDIVCKLASCVSARPPLADAGMVSRLAELTGLNGQPETLVRVLMGLAMLLGSKPEHLTDFAKTPKAIDNLAAVIRNSEDPDSKAIATSIFANLANDPETREAVSKALQTAKTGNAESTSK